MKWKLLAIALIGLVHSCTPAYAEEHCGNTKEMGDFLQSQYGETLRSVAVDNESLLMEVYQSQAGKTYTIVFRSMKNDVSCIASHGHDFTEVPQHSHLLPAPSSKS